MEITQRLPIKLMIEITENQTLTITPALKELIRSLRNRGVLFALDDFGTGYANLCYLNELDTDVIKIDKTFIKAIKEVEQHIPMLESIIHLSGLWGYAWWRKALNMAISSNGCGKIMWITCRVINFYRQ